MVETAGHVIVAIILAGLVLSVFTVVLGLVIVIVRGIWSALFGPKVEWTAEDDEEFHRGGGL